MPNPRIIVIGGNAAGPAAAAKAKRTNPDAEVLMYEAGNFISTGTCEIPYVLSGDIKNVNDIIHFDADEFYNKKGVKAFTNHSAEKIDPSKKVITIRQIRGNRLHEIKYDKLIISTGSISRDIGFKAENLFTLKNVKDLLSIKDYLTAHNIKNVLIIGAGFIGLEAAEAFKLLGYDVTLIDKNVKPLSSAEPEIQSLVLEKALENGIKFYQAESIKPFLSDNKINLVNVDGRLIETDLVISAIGFTPNNSLTDSIKMRKGETGAVKVDRFMRTSVPDIFAAGDLIEMTDKVSGKGMYLPLASLAHQSGHIAGENAAGGKSYFNPIVKNISLKFFDKFYVSAGLTSHEAKNFNLFYDSAESEVSNFSGNMPGNSKVYGKLIYNKTSKKIIGASFYGGRETEGFANIISALITLNQSVDILTQINYTYTPPLSQMRNLLSSLGWKLK